jgi:hypothetical protein
MPTHALNDTHLGSLAVYLQSRDASASLGSSSKLFYLNQLISPPPGTVILVGLISAEIPYSFYTVTTNNNTMTVKTKVGDLTSTHNVTIDPGNYDVDALTDALNLQVSNAKFSFNENSNKYKLEKDGPTDYVSISASSMHKIMGFSEEQLQSVPTAESIVATNCVNLAGTSSVYVNFPNLGIQNLDSRGDLNGVVAKLNVNCNPGEFIFYQQTETQYYMISNRAIQNFQLSLTDDDNNLLEMNGADFSVTLSVHFSKIREPFSANKYLVNRRNVPDLEDDEEPVKKEKHVKKKN